MASNASNPNLKKNYDLPVIVDLIKSVDTPLSFITKLTNQIERSMKKLDYWKNNDNSVKVLTIWITEIEALVKKLNY